MKKIQDDTYKYDRDTVEAILDIQKNKEWSFEDRLFMLRMICGNNLEKLTPNGNLWMITYPVEKGTHHIIFNEQFEIITLAHEVIGLTSWKSSIARITPLVEISKALEYDARGRKVIRHTFENVTKYNGGKAYFQAILNTYTGSIVDFLMIYSKSYKNMYFYKDFADQGLILAAHGSSRNNIETLKIYDMKTDKLIDTYKVIRDISDILGYKDGAIKEGNVQAPINNDSVYEVYNEKNPSSTLIINVSAKNFKAKPSIVIT